MGFSVLLIKTFQIFEINEPALAGFFHQESITVYLEGLRCSRCGTCVGSPLYTTLQVHLLKGEGHEYHLITGKEGQAPLGIDEFADMPERFRRP